MKLVKKIMDLMGKLPKIVKTLILLAWTGYWVYFKLYKNLDNIYMPDSVRFTTEAKLNYVLYAIVLFFLIYVFYIREMRKEIKEMKRQAALKPGLEFYNRAIANLTTDDKVWKFIRIFKSGIDRKDPAALEYKEAYAKQIFLIYDAYIQKGSGITLSTKLMFVEFIKEIGVKIEMAPPIDNYDAVYAACANLNCRSSIDYDLCNLIKVAVSDISEQNTVALINYLNRVFVIKNDWANGAKKLCYTYHVINNSDRVKDETKSLLKKAIFAQSCTEQDIEKYSDLAEYNKEFKELRICVITHKRSPFIDKKGFINEVKRLEAMNAQSKKIIEQAVQNSGKRAYKQPKSNNPEMNQEDNMWQDETLRQNEYMIQEMMRHNDAVMHEIMQQQMELTAQEAMKAGTPFDMGGYMHGEGFNPSDTMAADAMHQNDFNNMNDMNNMGGMDMF